MDDHPIFLTLLGELLREELDFELVGVAQNGRDGLDICARTQPDLVMVDMMMPGMSGLELIKILRRQRPKLLLLAISGSVTKELIHMAFNAGASGYFSKSRSIEELLQTLRSLSEGKNELTPEEAEALRWAMRERRLRREISTNDLELLRFFLDEVPVKEIAVRTGRTASAVYKAFKRIRQRLDTKSDRDLRLAAKGFGVAGRAESQN